MDRSNPDCSPEAQPTAEQLRIAAEKHRTGLSDVEALARVGRWEWNLSVDYVDASDEIYRIFGLEPGSVRFSLSRFLEVVHTDDRDTLRDAIEGALRGTELYDERFRVIRPDGGQRWVHSRGRVEFNPDGVATRMIGTVQDVTEQVFAEVDLRHREARFRGLFEQAAVGVAEIESASGRFVRINRKYCDIIGRSPKEIIGRTFQEITHPEDLQEDLDHIAELRAGTISEFSVEKRYVRPDGTFVWVELTVSPLRRTGQEPAHHVAVVADITEKKAATEALEKSERLFREMADHITEVFWLFDQIEQRVIYASPAYEAIWGRSIDELYADYDQWGKSIHPDDRPFAASSFARVLKTGGGEAREYRIVRPDGEVRWISDRAFVIRDDTGEVVRVAGIAEDISDKKQKEEERLALQSKIQHSQKLESLGVLAGGIAHDFNNLLGAVLGNADLALESIPPGFPGREFIEKIGRAAERAAGLTSQMLAYSGKGQFLVESVQLDRLVSEMAQLLETVISKKAKLQIGFSGDLPAVRADASQLRQIVMNLITNASEALGDRNGTIRIDINSIDLDRDGLNRYQFGDDLPEGRYACLEVTDTGSGMDEEVQRRIFDPFFTTKFTGRGLGLAAVLGIVRGHQGAINVTCEQGRGSTFSVLLPLSESSLSAAPLPGRRTGDEPAGSTVLVVDDDVSMLEVSQNMLQRSGFRVLTAVDGRKGVEVLEKNIADVALVVLDMTMPEMGGEETFEAMRRIVPDLRVILTSGYDKQDTSNRFVGCRPAGFLQKPYRSAELLAIIHSVLDESSPRAGSEVVVDD